MATKKAETFPKAPTGVNGLDEITSGGFPKGRPILICGSAGCGKTLFGVQFIVKGITEFNEPGVIMSFEETGKDLAQNVTSLGFDLDKMIADKKLRIDHVRIERSEIDETGEFDLEGLFIRLNHAIDSIGAKRVVLDTIESLFSGIDNQAILRSELRRLFTWLKEKGVTTVITGERGENSLTRQGLEEYVSDCVILLDFRVIDQIATRRLRIVKYRGSEHGTNEYPFIIDESGISVIPITSLKLDYKASKEVISTGLGSLDKLFHLNGLFRGTSTLITGTAGTAKTILSTYFAANSSRQKENVLYFSFEESPEQILRNSMSIGINLKPYVKSRMLYIHASRPSLQGLELHLAVLHKLLDELKPKMVIVDPISSLVTIGNNSEVRAMLVRLMDLLKVKGINAIFTALTQTTASNMDPTVDAVSSLADTWINVQNTDGGSGRKRTLLIVKSRGMGHYNNPCEFTISNKGITLSTTKK
jgi:circadian clock protein KaiC